MIDLTHYERILESGLMFDHFLVLCMIKNGEKLPKNRRVQGFINLLNKKGYIEDGALTDEGILMTDWEIALTTKEAPQDTDFTKWVIALHKKCQAKIFQLVGSKQIRGKVNGKSYNFLPNATDFAKALQRAIMVYKIKDTDKMEKAIMGHITKCHRENHYFPLIKYYIIKGIGSACSSDMATDIENPEEEVDNSGKSVQKFV